MTFFTYRTRHLEQGSRRWTKCHPSYPGMLEGLEEGEDMLYLHAGHSCLFHLDSPLRNVPLLRSAGRRSHQWKEIILSLHLRHSTLERSRGLGIRSPRACLPCKLHVNIRQTIAKNDPDLLADTRRVDSSRAKNLWVHGERNFMATSDGNFDLAKRPLYIYTKNRQLPLETRNTLPAF